MSSFCNERTVEYALVGPLQRAFKVHYKNVSLLFFWSTREGNRTSLKAHQAFEIRTLAVFARRPKLRDSGQLHGKINESLIEFSRIASSQGIPSIAGFPICSNIPALFDASIAWLDIDALSQETQFFAEQRGIESRLVSEDGQVLPCLSEIDLGTLMHARATPMQWPDLIKLLAALRKAAQYNNPFGRLGLWPGYRPIYVMCLDPKPSH